MASKIPLPYRLSSLLSLGDLHRVAFVIAAGQDDICGAASLKTMNFGRDPGIS
jgi:hypothetical protein